jgi:hypothetical protein
VPASAEARTLPGAARDRDIPQERAKKAAWDARIAIPMLAVEPGPCRRRLGKRRRNNGPTVF